MTKLEIDALAALKTLTKRNLNTDLKMDELHPFLDKKLMKDVLFESLIAGDDNSEDFKKVLELYRVHHPVNG